MFPEKFPMLSLGCMVRNVSNMMELRISAWMESNRRTAPKFSFFAFKNRYDTRLHSELALKIGVSVFLQPDDRNVSLFFRGTQTLRMQSVDNRSIGYTSHRHQQPLLCVTANRKGRRRLRKD